MTASHIGHNMALYYTYVKVAAILGFSAAAQLHAGVSSSVVSICGISWQNSFHSLLSDHYHSSLLHCWPFACLCVMSSSTGVFKGVPFNMCHPRCVVIIKWYLLQSKNTTISSIMMILLCFYVVINITLFCL